MILYSIGLENVLRCILKPTGETTNAFILRIWIEPRKAQDAELVWRGVIQHVASGKQVYFDELEEFTKYLATYLKSMGVKVDKLSFKKEVSGDDTLDR